MTARDIEGETKKKNCYLLNNVS